MKNIISPSGHVHKVTAANIIGPTDTLKTLCGARYRPKDIFYNTNGWLKAPHFQDPTITCRNCLRSRK